MSKVLEVPLTGNLGFECDINIGKGNKGDKGDTGSGVELRKNETHIQHKYTDSDTWVDLIAIEELKGMKGDAFVYEDFTVEQLLALKGEKGDTPDITHLETAIDNKIVEVGNVVADKIKDVETAVGNKITEVDKAVNDKIVEVNSTVNNKITEVNNTVDNKVAEVDRVIATVESGELERISNELLRMEGEETRCLSEEQRKSQETTRIEQELERQANSAKISKDEEQRIANEISRSEEEVKRNAQEVIREAQESVRQSEELKRQQSIKDMQSTIDTKVSEFTATVDNKIVEVDLSKNSMVNTVTESLADFENRFNELESANPIGEVTNARKANDGTIKANLSDRLSYDFNKKSNTGDSYLKSETYNKSEIDSAISNVEIDTSGLATKEELATKANVVHAHSYNDLTDKPNIPTVDADRSYVDAQDAITLNSAKEYTNAEIDKLNNLVVTIVSELPSIGEDNKVYLVKNMDTADNLYTEYIWVDNKWEIWGSASIDLSAYATKDELNANKTYVDVELAKKSDNHDHPYKPSSYIPTWNEVLEKPTTFNPSAHDHNDIYYTTLQVDDKIAKIESANRNTAFNADILSSQWVADGELFSVTINHGLGTKNIFVSVLESDTEESAVATYKIVDLNSIKIINESPVNAKVVVINGGSKIDIYDSVIDDSTVVDNRAWSGKKVFGELAKKSDVHEHPYKSNDYVPNWNDITGKPSEFNPSSHNHDSSYASKSSEHTHANKVVLDGVTSEKIASWDGKSNFNGDYNSLTNKPNIPTVDVNKNYVDSELAKKVDVVGHILTDNNYTTADKSKLDGISANANNYIHPNDANTRHVTDSQISGWNAKSDAHEHPYKPSSYAPTWSEVGDKPTTFNPTSHRHNVSEIDNLSMTASGVSYNKNGQSSVESALDSLYTEVSGSKTLLHSKVVDLINIL